MFTELRLLNLKAWGKDLWNPPMKLGPVTLLLGPNSSGKTSLIQSLLLLRQTFSSPDRQLDLNLGGQEGDILDLGTFLDVVHRHDKHKELGIAFKTEDGEGHEVRFALAGGIPATQLLKIEKGNRVYSAERQSKGGYLLAAPDYEPRQIGNRLDSKRAFAPERSIAFSAAAIAELGPVGSEVQDLSLALTKRVHQIAYLGPLREAPARSYLWSRQSPGNLGVRGQFAVMALLASANSLKKRRKGDEGGRGWLVDQVSVWLKRLGVADSLEMVRHGRSRYFEVIVRTQKQKANIVDVGFGISQVLPLLVLAYFVPRGATIIAEQPEIHLHPGVQTELANLMVEVSRKRKVQFIVETHSEDIFRRMQFLVADRKISPADCRMYFISMKRQKAQIEALQMDDYGRISNWPDHFFGDVIGETERQMRRMFERLSQAEPKKSRRDG